MAREVSLTPDLAARLREMVAALDDEDFCPTCRAGMESSEHHEMCVAPLDQIEGDV